MSRLLMPCAPAFHLTGLLLSPYRSVCNLLASKSFTNIYEYTKSVRGLNTFHIVKCELDSNRTSPKKYVGFVSHTGLYRKLDRMTLSMFSSHRSWFPCSRTSLALSPTQVINSSPHCMEVCVYLQKAVQSGHPTL